MQEERQEKEATDGRSGHPGETSSFSSEGALEIKEASHLWPVVL